MAAINTETQSLNVYVRDPYIRTLNQGKPHTLVVNLGDNHKIQFLVSISVRDRNLMVFIKPKGRRSETNIDLNESKKTQYCRQYKCKLLSYQGQTQLAESVVAKSLFEDMDCFQKVLLSLEDERQGAVFKQFMVLIGFDNTSQPVAKSRHNRQLSSETSGELTLYKKTGPEYGHMSMPRHYIKYMVGLVCHQPSSLALMEPYIDPHSKLQIVDGVIETYSEYLEIQNHQLLPELLEVLSDDQDRLIETVLMQPDALSHDLLQFLLHLPEGKYQEFAFPLLSRALCIQLLANAPVCLVSFSTFFETIPPALADVFHSETLMAKLFEEQVSICRTIIVKFFYALPKNIREQHQESFTLLLFHHESKLDLNHPDECQLVKDCEPQKLARILLAQFIMSPKQVELIELLKVMINEHGNKVCLIIHRWAWDNSELTAPLYARLLQRMALDAAQKQCLQTLVVEKPEEIDEAHLSKALAVCQLDVEPWIKSRVLQSQYKDVVIHQLLKVMPPALFQERQMQNKIAQPISKVFFEQLMSVPLRYGVRLDEAARLPLLAAYPARAVANYANKAIRLLNVEVSNQPYQVIKTSEEEMFIELMVRLIRVGVNQQRDFTVAMLEMLDPIYIHNAIAETQLRALMETHSTQMLPLCKYTKGNFAWSQVYKLQGYENGKHVFELLGITKFDERLVAAGLRGEQFDDKDVDYDAHYFLQRAPMGSDSSWFNWRLFLKDKNINTKHHVLLSLTKQQRHQLWATMKQNEQTSQFFNLLLAALKDPETRKRYFSGCYTIDSSEMQQSLIDRVVEKQHESNFNKLKNIHDTLDSKHQDLLIGRVGSYTKDLRAYHQSK
ncbi:hypothetical protein [Parashewanella tropica]|uniref:hypothetical protein n=1 Tax=Parashewanella tropica TaxID=2547970 RepID=UPI0010597F3B|nr:hypothetical protein [Parashewanella tropica]